MHFKAPDEPIDFAVLSQNDDLYKKNAPKGHNLSVLYQGKFKLCRYKPL